MACLLGHTSLCDLLEGLGMYVHRGVIMVRRGEIQQMFTAALKCFIRLLGNHRVIQGPVRLHKPVAEQENYITFQQMPSVSISLSSQMLLPLRIVFILIESVLLDFLIR